MINTVNVHAHRVILGQDAEQHSVLQNFVRDALRSKLSSLNIDTIDVYNMGGKYHTHTVGNTHRLVFFLNASSKNNGETQAIEPAITIGDEITPFNVVLQPSGEGIIIVDANGVPIAEYIDKAEEGGQHIVNVLFDVFSHDAPVNRKAFEFILTELERVAFFPKTLRNSWVHSQEKDRLTKRFTDRIKDAQTRNMRADKERMERMQHEIENYQREMKNRYDNVIRLRAQVELAEKQLKDVDEKLIKELDNIVAHEKIKDMHIKDGKFIVYTELMHFYHDQNGDKYRLGNMRIEIDPANTSIRFFSDNNRRGYWRDSPHPHVNSEGSACLGNVGGTIAELSSQMEIYALVMVGIDFLENINTSDPAGRSYSAWDKVDEEGNVIEEGHNYREDD